MERREDLLEVQRYRRAQAAFAMFNAGPAHVSGVGPGVWAGPVLGLLVALVLCAVGPVVEVVTKAPASPGTAVPGVPSPAAPEVHQEGRAGVEH